MPRIVGDKNINKMWSLPLRIMKTKVQVTSHYAMSRAPQRRNEESAEGLSLGKLRRMPQTRWVVRRQVRCMSRHKWIGDMRTEKREQTKNIDSITLWLIGRKQRNCKSYWDDFKSVSGNLYLIEFSEKMEMFSPHCSILQLLVTHNCWTLEIWLVQMID